MNKTPKSPWRPQVTLAAALAVSRAGRRRSNVLLPRLGADFFDVLDAETVTLQELLSGRSGSKETLKGKTRELQQVLAETHTFLSAARAAIATHFPAGHAMRSNFGLGIKTNAKSMKHTLDALRQFVRGMEQYPTEAAAASLGPADLAKLKGFLAEIPNADNSQENSKDQRKAATALLESTNHSVYSRLNRLKVAVALDLAHDPKAQNEIVGPLPAAGAKKKNAPVEQ